MSLPYGLLGLLTYQDSTGYDLTKVFEDSLNNFWHAQSSQIYRELARMEELGWVSSCSIIQDGRPNKRLYSITENGQDELAKWLSEAKLEFENNHNAMLVRIFFGAHNPQATLELLRSCCDMCRSAVEDHCESIRKNIDSYAATVDNGYEKSKYWSMTLDYSIIQTRATLEWAERCIEQIIKELEE